MKVGKAKRLKRQARLARQRNAWRERRATLLGQMDRVQTYDRAFIALGDGPWVQTT